MDDGDAALVERARAGDAGAMAALLDRHEPLVRGMLGQVLGARADLTDLLQETRLRGIAAFRGDAAFGTWVSRIAMNLAVSELRRRRETSALPLGAAGGEEPWVHAQRVELRERLAAAVDRLPPAMRQAFDLRYREELTSSEISARLDLPAATVRTRLFHARRRLREELDGLVSD